MKFISILLILFISFSNLHSQDRLKVATIDLDNHFITNKQLRKDFIKIFHNYSSLTYKRTITVDGAKKKLYGKKVLNLKEGREVAKKLGVEYAVMFTTKKVYDTKNKTSSKTYNSFMLNNNKRNLSTLIEDGLDKANDRVVSNTNTTYDTYYYFFIMNIETGELLKKYNPVPANEVLKKYEEIMKYLDYYYSFLLLNSITKPNNNLELNFYLERINLEKRTNIIEDIGKILAGESFNIKFNANNDGYLYIFALQNNGNLLLMYPNDFNIDPYKEESKLNILSNENYIIPPENSIFSMKVSPTYTSDNIDSFYAIYTKNNINWEIDRYFQNDGFKICNANRVSEFVKKLKYKVNVILPSDYTVAKVYLNSIPQNEANMRKVEREVRIEAAKKAKAKKKK